MQPVQVYGEDCPNFRDSVTLEARNVMDYSRDVRF